MFQEKFYQTYLGEIFVKSQCMQHESNITDFFRSCLINLGYVTQDVARRIWHRGNRTVVVCLADDFNVCGADLAKPPSHWFDRNTVIITDNHIMLETQYTVCQLPTSYFGIFSYTPTQNTYQPNRRFNFSVNRLDSQREIIFLEYLTQSGGLDKCLELDYINFNAWDATGLNHNHDQIQQNFLRYWKPLNLTNRYQSMVDNIVGKLPIRNHNLSLEQANLHSWLTPVIETYSGNTTVALSEKIFRALQSCTPWTLWSATGTIKYLQSLGFDVLDDLINHDYNTVQQDSPHGLHKCQKFIESCLLNYQKLQSISLDEIQRRCLKASVHNKQLLENMRKNWPIDFANWLPKTINKLL